MRLEGGAYGLVQSSEAGPVSWGMIGQAEESGIESEHSALPLTISVERTNM